MEKLNKLRIIAIKLNAEIKFHGYFVYVGPIKKEHWEDYIAFIKHFSKKSGSLLSAVLCSDRSIMDPEKYLCRKREVEINFTLYIAKLGEENTSWQNILAFDSTHDDFIRNRISNENYEIIIAK